MSDEPFFFVPHADPDGQERAYAAMAKDCHCAVPPIGRRIFSISYLHDGETWTATVGETLHGTRAVRKGSKKTRREYTEGVSDPALVLAIFEGNPYMVFTNAGITSGVRSAWVNPFMAGIPSVVRYFRAAP